MYREEILQLAQNWIAHATLVGFPPERGNSPWKVVQAYNDNQPLPPVVAFNSFPVAYLKLIHPTERGYPHEFDVISNEEAYMLMPMTKQFLVTYGSFIYPSNLAVSTGGNITHILNSTLQHLQDPDDLAMFICLLFYAVSKERASTLAEQLDLVFHWVWDYSSKAATSLAGTLQYFAASTNTPVVVQRWYRAFCNDMLELIMRLAGTRFAWSFRYNKWGAASRQHFENVLIMQKVYNKIALRSRAEITTPRMDSPRTGQFDRTTLLYGSTSHSYPLRHMAMGTWLVELCLRISNVNPTGSSEYPSVYYDNYGVVFGTFTPGERFYGMSQDAPINALRIMEAENDVPDGTADFDGDVDNLVAEFRRAGLENDDLYRWKDGMVKHAPDRRISKFRIPVNYLLHTTNAQGKNIPIKEWDPTAHSEAVFLRLCGYQNIPIPQDVPPPPEDLEIEL